MKSAYQIIRRPVITEKGPPPPDAKEWEGKPDKPDGTRGRARGRGYGALKGDIKP